MELSRLDADGRFPCFGMLPIKMIYTNYRDAVASRIAETPVFSWGRVNPGH